jgi:glycine/D-amino acid oxidase-like deaminating enzyme
VPIGADIVVVGAGMVGCAVAARLGACGADVLVLERAEPAAGPAGGNIVVSNTLPGADLEIAQRSAALWRLLADEIGEQIEYEQKAGIVVAASEGELASLFRLAEGQARQGVQARALTGDELHCFEPGLSPDLPGGVLYPEDAQVQPTRAVQAHMARILRHGGLIATGVEVIGAELDHSGMIRRLRTNAGGLSVGSLVVDAAGAWAGELSERLGTALPVLPRRGHVLVTEPVAPLTARTIYEAGYVADIHDSEEGWSASAVVEATRAGTMLLGSSREFAGFSRVPNPTIIATIAQRAVALFPGLADVRLMRSSVGFRPATPDNRPAIGPDPLLANLVHATGHEGAGIALAEATAEAVAHVVFGTPVGFDLAPFSPGRFRRGGAA